MKASRYNHFFDLSNGGKLLFNSASAALAEIYPEKLALIEKLLSNNHPPASEEETQLREALVSGKYLVEESTDELAAQKNRNRTRRLEPDTFILTIAPTLACNFNCDYCFETQRPGRMNDETVEALLRFSEKYISGSKAVLITWFGGEPTLTLPIIEKVQSGMKELAGKYKARLHPAAIITNGYLLDGIMAKRLVEAGVTGAQITIDGPPEIHDRRRRLHSGKGTFERIIQNLRESSKILKILVRVNVDRANFDSAFEVTEILKSEKILNKVNVYFSQVDNSEGVCADMKDRCLSSEEFSRTQVELYRKLIERGFCQIEYPSLAPGGHCGADSEASFVVVPNGDLFKCWEETALDSRFAVGNIFREEIYPHEQQNLDRYLKWDPFETGSCSSCGILPLCMGGCPHHRQANPGEINAACSSWKFNLDEMMRLRYQCDLLKGGE